MTGAALTVVKLGGSLLADRARLRERLAALASGAEGPCVLVPGGGPFADAVIAAQAVAGFSDALAHRLALDAMGSMAAVFEALEPRLTSCADIAALADRARAGRAPVWNPSALRAGHPEIPESWDVTSDSLALWLAARLGAERCLLVKSADAPAGADPSTLARLGLVDPAFPAFAARFPGRIVFQGPGARPVRSAA